MSTDYDVVCMTCKQRSHLGQAMGGVSSFGYGTGDLSGAYLIARLIMEDHRGHDLRIFLSDDGPDYHDSPLQFEEWADPDQGKKNREEITEQIKEKEKWFSKHRDEDRKRIWEEFEKNNNQR